MASTSPVHFANTYPAGGVAANTVGVSACCAIVTEAVAAGVPPPTDTVPPSAASADIVIVRSPFASNA